LLTDKTCFCTGQRIFMPEISRFLGISIRMYFNDHNPPHFHVKYNDYRAPITIKELKISEGYLPKRVHMLVIEWAIENRTKLLKNWNSIHDTGTFKKIEPLV